MEKFIQATKRQRKANLKCYTEKSKEDRLRASLKHRYGITIEQYNMLFDRQEGCCAICGIHQKELKQSLCVDHNHKTREIRGLLCSHCNLALGHFRDRSDRLWKAILYLGK